MSIALPLLYIMVMRAASSIFYTTTKVPKKQLSTKHN